MTLLNELINEQTEEGQRDKPLNEEVNPNFRSDLHQIRRDLTDVVRNLTNIGQSDDSEALSVQKVAYDYIDKARQALFNLRETP